VFMLMQGYEKVWSTRRGSTPAELFGFRYDVGLDPVEVNVERMVTAFRHGCRDLREVWNLALQPQTLADLEHMQLAACEGPTDRFHLDDDLWARIVLDFACAYKRDVVSRGIILRSLTPLYLGRVASFVLETRNLVSAEVEERIEQLCLKFEELKPYLLSHWNEERKQEARVEADVKLEHAAAPSVEV
jgi:hypothetical protein